VGKTQSIKIRRGVGLYKQTNKNGLASPKWYHRIYLPIGDKKVYPSGGPRLARPLSERC